MIETKNLTKIFKIAKDEAIQAVMGLDLMVAESEVFGFLGPNGAGKTTTIRMLTSLIGPTTGTARVNGYQLGRDDQQIRASVGILTESPGLFGRLSAKKNLEIYAKLYEVDNMEKQISKYLHMLDLWKRKDDPVGSFSKGMRQKMAIARALLHEPRLLFLDEPTSGLDPEAARMIRQFIEALRSEGRTIFLCTHNLNEADQLCDRIGIFKTRLIEIDRPENMRKKLFGHKVKIQFRSLDPGWITLVNQLDGVIQVEGIDNTIVVDLSNPEQQNPHIIRELVNSGADILFVGELKHSLEDIYLQTIQDIQMEDQAT